MKDASGASELMPHVCAAAAPARPLRLRAGTPLAEEGQAIEVPRLVAVQAGRVGRVHQLGRVRDVVQPTRCPSSCSIVRHRQFVGHHKVQGSASWVTQSAMRSADNHVAALSSSFRRAANSEYTGPPQPVPTTSWEASSTHG